MKCVTSKQLFSFTFPDAFARVIFGDKAADTSVIWETRNPTWNQTLIFNDIIIWGSMDHVVENPPTIIIEIFDFDDGVRKRVCHVFLSLLECSKNEMNFFLFYFIPT